jgi:YggT family protein
MNGGYFSQAFVFLISTVCDLYLLAVILRFLLQIVGADFYNPISQFLVKLTNPPLRLLRRFIPGFRGTDWSSVILMFAIQSLEVILVSLAAYGFIPALPGLLVSALAGILHMLVYLFIVAVFVQVLLSWFGPDMYSPATVILYRLTEPLLRQARQILPSAGGIDFSPILVFVALQLANILIVNPLFDLGRAWS